jgi:hypothetical protein
VISGQLDAAVSAAGDLEVEMISAVPSWAIAIMPAAVFVLSVEAGWRLYGALRDDPNGATTGAGYIVCASLGLLSLLIGFTLAMSLNRYETRSHLVVDEASAISTTWLRDQMLDQPFRARLDVLLREYVAERRTLASVGTSQSALDAADQRAAALQQRIWQETMAAPRTPNGLPVANTVLLATNEMFDLPAARRAALDAEVPAPVLWKTFLPTLRERPWLLHLLDLSAQISRALQSICGAQCSGLANAYGAAIRITLKATVAIRSAELEPMIG